ncbi:efflux RND transporter permease subunit [Novosphingobium pentaromativorans]|uniref:AcrB/AcrD/AcrF family protein n=1 Tax=Novosphingobium pentaromativorans US6-1 TaxID=1088721 RepID=G6EFR7_9SPHN|nr:efflux RND transporter permease subunit [Novosphingobium pentaromativorans]AIT81814.1 acriflavine resistance protein B [Novosphingobium pentaromativorans US6-1]EHJ59845.1 AcrB/AcrD/AcrF family protein [Novosphingobium pentaromativorans US6-1]
MLKRIIRLCLGHPVMVTLAAFMLLILGTLTVMKARYDVFPEFVPPQAVVQTEAPGMTPEQVEALVTRPLEAVVNGANGVAMVRSESVPGLSVINVTFVDGSDPYRARQVIAEAVAEAASQLPAGVDAPKLTPLTSSTMDLLKIGFLSDKLSPMQLRDIVEWQVRPRLLAARGVARINVFGGEQRRIEVQVKPAELVARNMALSDVEGAVQAATAIRGGGFAETPNQRILVEPTSGAVTPQAIAEAVVPTGSGPAIRIGDIADVRYAPAPKYGDALIMGRPGLLLTLSSQYGANTLDTTRTAEAALADLLPALKAQGIKVYPALHRPANFIQTALAGIQIDLLIGAALIAFVLMLFLRDLRVAMIAFLSIPLSLLAALIVLDTMGETINTMTLGGLAVALGVVIDDAIVDLENIVRRLRMAPDGASRAAIIEAAAIEVRGPVVYATYVLALTIMPILFLTGLQGAFFGPLALSFLLATLASLAVAVTVTPALAMLMLGQTRPHSEPAFLARIKDGHARLLEAVCARPGQIALASAIVGILAVAGFSAFGSELLPSFRERHYVLSVRGPAGSSMAWMHEQGARISHDLLTIPGIATVEQQIGRAEVGEDIFPPSESEIHVELNGNVGGHAEQTILGEIRAVLGSYPGINTETQTFLGDRIGESLSGETAKVAIGIYGADLDTLDRVAGRINAVLRTVSGAADVQMKSQPQSPTMHIRLDAGRMALHGVSPSDAQDAIELAFQGRKAAQVAQADRITEVSMTLPPGTVSDPEELGKVLVRGAGGSTVPLGEIASLAMTEGRPLINHVGGQRLQVVTANPTRNDIAGFVHDAKAAIARQVKLPQGVYLDFGGEAAGQAAAQRQLTINVAVAAVGMIALLLLAFGGPRPAALILTTAPFAMVGGVVAVALTGGVLSLGALVGFVTLFGISARNAILLIAHTDHLVSTEGEPWTTSTVLRATRERVTPILMTALVTGLGLAPLALEAGQAGREIQGAMAIVILGGLISSTTMSLIALPALILAFRHPKGEIEPALVTPGE